MVKYNMGLTAEIVLFDYKKLRCRCTVRFILLWIPQDNFVYIHAAETGSYQITDCTDTY